jgi:hydroxymethylglutaryl-CoA lyase
VADREVRIYEVGPRDGLQNEATPIPTDAKLRFIGLLADAGLREIEATSFVSPGAIPQLADADDLLARLDRRDGVRYPVLVPNRRGLERAVAAGADAICVFTAASEAFTKANINMTIAESLEAFGAVVEHARTQGWWTRAYISTAFGCPYQGTVGEAAVVGVANELLALGVDELSIGDTIGVAGPADVRRVVTALIDAGIPVDGLAMHFHDTRGTALANVTAALELGIRCFDASTGGAGGCPYAPGAAGNLATGWTSTRSSSPHARSAACSAARWPRRSARRVVGDYHRPPMDPEASQPPPRPLVLDVDTGIDDMIALLIAATSPELNLRGVTCVAGNVEIHHVARNTGKLLRMVGRGDVPVSIGAARPLQRRLRTAPDTHGPTGTGYVELRGEDRQLGTTEYTAVPASRYLGAHVARHPGEMSIVALGPLTNLASAIQQGVDLAGSARDVIWMGGTLEERGNTTETGEWNACVDPEAAEICLAAGAIHRIFPLDATQDVVFTMDDLGALPDTHLAGVVRDAVRFYVAFHRQADGIDGAYLHDPVVLIASLLRPDLVTETVTETLACDTSSDAYLAGSLYRSEDSGRRAVSVATAIDPEGMRRELVARLARAVAAPFA